MSLPDPSASLLAHSAQNAMEYIGGNERFAANMAHHSNVEAGSDEASHEQAVNSPGIHPAESTRAAVTLQAAFRGFLARKQYDMVRTTRLWAAVKVQSAFRAKKAKGRLAKLVR